MSRPRLVGTPAITLAAVALVAALALAVGAPQSPLPIACLAGLGVVLAVIPAARAGARTLRRHPELVGILALAGLLAVWIAAGLLVASAPGGWVQLRQGALMPADFDIFYPPGPSWPWRLHGLPLLPLGLALLSAGGGCALVSDAVRVALGLAPPSRSAWRSLTAHTAQRPRVAARAVPGVALIVVVAFLAISLISHYFAWNPVLAALGMLGVGALAALLVAVPVAVGLATRVDFDKALNARDAERRRLAAHLHDSVLQTLALVQRQASDSDAVARIARRQEHALRAWMAGGPEFAGETIVAAMRMMVSDVEEEHGVAVSLTAIGDADLSPRGEQLVAAAREALRNAGRHAAGAPVTVFLDIDADRAELFVRDEGPGFEPDAVPDERRGLRDAIIGRMDVAGGIANVESAPGEGTEITLLLPLRPR